MTSIITIIPISDFNNSKTRLSPFLSNNERKQLLKFMLKDIINSIKEEVTDIIITSADDEVLNYANKLGVSILKEHKHDTNKLNNTLIDSINYLNKKENGNYSILLLPTDIPLIRKNNINYLKNNKNKIIIAPSSGGGTNLLFFNKNSYIKPQFGEFSFLNHLNYAKKEGFNYEIYDSFYLSLDINTPNDLGELLIHGKDTESYNYIKNIGIKVESKHGQVRLNVQR